MARWVGKVSRQVVLGRLGGLWEAAPNKPCRLI